jgi:hypothetical protein
VKEQNARIAAAGVDTRFARTKPAWARQFVDALRWYCMPSGPIGGALSTASGGSSGWTVPAPAASVATAVTSLCNALIAGIASHPHPLDRKRSID